MASGYFEIRTCKECGLRYPTREGDPAGLRCPACAGLTKVTLMHRPADRDRPPMISRPRVQLAVLMDNVRSALNVGAILRTAEGFGFERACLCGITPTPTQKAVRKTALGAETQVPWSYHRDSTLLAAGLKRSGHRLLCLESHETAIPLSEFDRGLTAPAPGIGGWVIVVGNERSGVDPGLLALSDRVCSIPMVGVKESFNVSVAFGIAAYTLFAHFAGQE